MTPYPDLLLHAAIIGIGGTVVMDLWALFLKRCFGEPSLDYAMVGRWVGHLVRGRLMHPSILQAAPVRGEAVIGWMTHYLVGIVFAAVLLAFTGSGWARNPTLLPALIFGIVSVIAPFLLLQPGMGAGLAASRTPRPNAMRLRSLMAHVSFGIGLYIAAWVLARVIAG